jgi:hypothetical protein
VREYLYLGEYICISIKVMKKSELVKIIRVAVREELKSTLPSILEELSNKVPHLSAESKDTNIVEIARHKINKVRKTKPQKQYSKNKAINEILNETVGGIPHEGSMVSGGVAPATEFTDMNGQRVDVDSLPDHVSSALTRNYSDVLNLVDKKKKGTV